MPKVPAPSIEILIGDGIASVVRELKKKVGDSIHGPHGFIVGPAGESGCHGIARPTKIPYGRTWKGCVGQVRLTGSPDGVRDSDFLTRPCVFPSGPKEGRRLTGYNAGRPLAVCFRDKYSYGFFISRAGGDNEVSRLVQLRLHA